MPIIISFFQRTQHLRQNELMKRQNMIQAIFNMYQLNLEIIWIWCKLYQAFKARIQKISMDEQEDYYNGGEQFDQATINQVKLSSFKNYKRPELPANLQKDDLYIMNIDISSTVKMEKSKNGVIKAKPKIKIFGVNQTGNSFEVNVQGFIPYFYSELPRNLMQDDSFQYVDKIRNKINQKYVQLQKSKHSKQYIEKNPVNEEPIIKIEKVDKKNIRNYIPDQLAFNTYWKISTSAPNVINPLRRLFQAQTYVDGLQLARQTFQSNIPYVLRFMIDKDIVGMGWIKIHKNMFTKRSSGLVDSLCQAQIDCHVDAIQPMPCNDQWSKMPPIRILSFDIECAAEHGFPDPTKHKVIQIACVCKTSTLIQDDYRVVFVLNGASGISGVHVQSTNSQQQLLNQFQGLIANYDPDFIIGYNHINFDLRYILQRAEFLKIKNYGTFGRALGYRSRVKNSTLKSKQLGDRQTKQINIEGRIQLDLLIHMHRDHKLTSYRLNNVAYHFLKEQKQDVHHTQIYKLFNQGRESRKRLAIYCLKDAQLPLKLMEKLCCLYNYSQMARVTGVPINYLLSRGQQIKVMSQLLRKAKQHSYISPTQRVVNGSDDKNYQGAYVLDPVAGFYEDPIATLDFASLYPSIMIAHNLCYTTLIRKDQLTHKTYSHLRQQDITQTTQGFFFVKSNVKKGILPQILQQLIVARKKAKNQLKKATDPMMIGVLQGRQLALKISANSVYGFTGATVGQLPCLQISSSTTGFGRQMIDQTRQTVLKNYPGSQVIYGDTDSVMVRFKLQSPKQVSKQQKIRQAMMYGRQAAQKITQQLFADLSPIKLEFQKVYCPYLLMAKKRYAGVYYTKPQTYDKIDKKGIQSVRRDNCVLIRQMLQKILEMVLCECNIQGTIQYIKQTVSMLVQNKIDISKLVITKSINKKTDEEDDDENQKKDDKKNGKNTYKVKQAHVQLAQKMRHRDKNVNISIGDRISYVMINGQKGSKNYDNAEDPIKVLNEDLPIDYEYYINKQLKPPLQRLLKNTKIIQNLDMLFSGEHTKNRYVPKLNKSNFMFNFVKVQSTCINCPTMTNDTFCDRCQPKAIDIYFRKESQLQELKEQYQNLWTECQSCQGSLTMQILCENLDCPIFFRRIKVKNDIIARKQQLERIVW